MQTIALFFKLPYTVCLILNGRNMSFNDDEPRSPDIVNVFNANVYLHFSKKIIIIAVFKDFILYAVV